MFTLRNSAETLIVPPNHIVTLGMGRLALDLLRDETAEALALIESAHSRFGELDTRGIYRAMRRNPNVHTPLPLQPGKRIIIGRDTGLKTPGLLRNIDAGIVVYTDDELDRDSTKYLADMPRQLLMAADQTLSRRHAAIWFEPDYGVTIRDLNSTNGTTVAVHSLEHPGRLYDPAV